MAVEPKNEDEVGGEIPVLRGALTKEKPTPLAVLRVQAHALSLLTGGVVTARVVEYMEAGPGDVSNSAIYILMVHAPVLHAFVEVLRLDQPTNVAYPVSLGRKKPDEDRHWLFARDYEEFMQYLGSILDDPALTDRLVELVEQSEAKIREPK